ncbi:MAG: thioredoxin-like domain-containing protein [Myxococcota bacterium]
MAGGDRVGGGRAAPAVLGETDGGLTLAGADQPPLFATGRPTIGGAEPNANATAALGLVRAARLFDAPEWADRAERILRSVQAFLGRAPRALGLEAIAGAWLSEGGSELAIAGDPAADDTRALIDQVRSRYLPFTVVARVGPDGAIPGAEVPPWIVGKTAVGGRATAYLCEGHTCQLPTSDPEILDRQLNELVVRAAPVTASVGLRIHAPAWVGGVPHPLASLRGKVVVLDFWTSCCVNCQHVLPELAAIEERYADQPVVVLGIHCAKFPAEERDAHVRAAVVRLGITHPVVNDPDHDVWEAYVVRSWPTVVVVDPTGRIALHQSGETTAADLSKVIDALLAEGRAAGTVAEAGSGGAAGSGPVIELHADPRSTARGWDPGGDLRFPGKVHVWPDAFDQEMGSSAFDGTGRLYVADTGHHRVLEVQLGLGPDGWPACRRLRVFGTGEPGLVDGGPDQAQFRGPQGIRRHADTLFVADTDNHALRAIDLATGQVRTLAGTGARGERTPTRDELARPLELPLRSPWDVEVMTLRDHHLVFVAMAGSHQIWVYGAGHLGLHAGSGREDHVDGPAATAALAQPSGLAMLGRYLLFVDAETSSVRAVDLQSHHVVTVVGRGLFDFGDVDGPAERVRMQHPLALTFIGDLVYVADTFNGKIKGIGLQSGETHTVAAGFDEPGGIARAGSWLVVADTNHHRIRVVSAETGEVRELRGI